MNGTVVTEGVCSFFLLQLGFLACNLFDFVGGNGGGQYR